MGWDTARLPVEQAATDDAGDLDFTTAFFLAFGTPPPAAEGAGDHLSEATWNAALHQERQVQEQLTNAFQGLSDNAAAAINHYLAASYEFRTAFAGIQSTTTQLQGYLTQWQEARGIYEASDLAFGLVNLTVGLGKLGLRVIRWVHTAKAPAAATQTAQAGSVLESAGGVARAGDEVAGGAAAGGGKLAPPPGFDSGAATGGGSAATRVTKIDEGRDFVRAMQEAPPALRRPPVAQDLGTTWNRLANEAGVDLNSLFYKHGGDLEGVGLDLIQAVAKTRGWHEIPWELETAISHLLSNGRIGVAAVAAGRKPPDLAADLAILAEHAQRTPGFWRWLATAMGELQAEGITLLYTLDDIAFLDALLKSGGDINKLRQMIGPVRTAALQSLAGAAQTGTGLGRGEGTTPPTTPTTTGSTGDSARDQFVREAANVYGATGPLGQVSLGSVVDEFGVTDRITQGQGFTRAALGEFWEFFTSPSATIASHYWTHTAQIEYLRLLQNHGDDLNRLAAALNDAIQALGEMGTAFQSAGLQSESSILGGKGAADLQQALDDLQRAFDNASPAWKAAHGPEMAGLRAHIEQKLADLKSSVEDFREIATKLPLMIQWLDGLQRMPDGTLRSSTHMFNPEIFVRLASIGLFLRALAGGAFLLNTDSPLEVVSVPPPDTVSPEERARRQEEYWQQQEFFERGSSLTSDDRWDPETESYVPSD